MSIITISRGTLSGGRALAAEIAERLDYESVDREELAHETNLFGVPAALLEAAMERPPIVRQQLARERDQYLTGMSMALCRRVMKGNIVYNGHSGHMLLPGIPTILRVRVLAGIDYRRHAVQRELGLSHNAAARYIRQVDAHRDRWVRFLYGVDWHDPLHYDLIVDLDQVGINNAAEMIVAMAQEPGHSFTPAVASLLNDLYLASVANFALLTDPRTALTEAKVTSRESDVQVTCPTRQGDRVPRVLEVLGEIDGIRKARCTIADKSFLLIQQKFASDAPDFARLIELAQRKRAAIELMYFTSEGSESTAPMVMKDEGEVVTAQEKQSATDRAAISDKTASAAPPQGLEDCLKELERNGCNGGSSLFFGSLRALLPALQRRARYDMVVLGELFVDKPEPVRVRSIADAKTLFADNLTLPVVESEELHTRFRFGLVDAVTLVLTLVISVFMFILLFKYRTELMSHLPSVSSQVRKFLVVAIALVLVPGFAFVYGAFTRKLLKLFRFE